MAYDPPVINDHPTALYRLFNRDGQLLYAGITRDVQARMRAHRASKEWWPQVAEQRVEWFPNRPAAAAAEVKALRTERPAYDQSYRQAAGAHLPPRPIAYPPPPSRDEPVPAGPETQALPPRDDSRWADMARRAGKVKPRRGCFSPMDRDPSSRNKTR